MREEGREGEATEGNTGSAHEESCCFTIDVRGRRRGRTSAMKSYDTTLNVIFVLLYIVLIVDCNFLKSGCCLCVVSPPEGGVEYSLIRFETARKGRGHVA